MTKQERRRTMTEVEKVREVDCPRCHEQCGWCSDYRWMHARFNLPGTRRKCTIPNMAPEGDDCPFCLGKRRVLQTVTYAPVQSAQGETPASCNLGVGCDEGGVCYAAAHGKPEQCGRAPNAARGESADERQAAIVAYLRECEATHATRTDHGPHKTASRHHKDACHYAAKAIESGEWRK